MNRHETEKQTLKREEEEMRNSLEACRVRVSELEEALAEGGKQEDGLKEVVRAARCVRGVGGRAFVCLCS